MCATKAHQTVESVIGLPIEKIYMTERQKNCYLYPVRLVSVYCNISHRRFCEYTYYRKDVLYQENLVQSIRQKHKKKW